MEGVRDEEISLYQKENMGPYRSYSRVQRGKLQGASSPIQQGVKRVDNRRQEVGNQQRSACTEGLIKEDRRERHEWVKRWLKSENQFQSNRSVDLGDPGLDQRPSNEDKGEERRVEARELGRKDNPRKGSKVKEALADSGWGSAGANSEEELRKEVASLKMAWAKVLRDQQPEKLLLTEEGKESSAEGEELRKEVDGLKKEIGQMAEIERGIGDW